MKKQNPFEWEDGTVTDIINLDNFTVRGFGAKWDANNGPKSPAKFDEENPPVA